MIGRHLSRSRRTTSPSKGRRERSECRKLRTSPCSTTRRVSHPGGQQRSMSAHSNAEVIRPSFLAVLARLSTPCLDRVLFLRASHPSRSFRRCRRYFHHRLPKTCRRLYLILHPNYRQQGPTRSPSTLSWLHPVFSRRRRDTRPRLLPPHRWYHRRRSQILLIHRVSMLLPERGCRARRSLSQLLPPPRLSSDLRTSSPPIIRRILAFHRRPRH